VALVLAPGVEVLLSGPDAGAYLTRLAAAVATARGMLHPGGRTAPPRERYPPARSDACGARLAGHPHPCARPAGHGGVHESAVGGTWTTAEAHPDRRTTPPPAPGTRRRPAPDPASPGGSGGRPPGRREPGGLPGAAQP